MCGRCITRELSIDFALSFYPYEGVLRDVVLALKLRGRPALWGEVRRLLVEGLSLRRSQGVIEPFQEANLVVPVPLHWRRVWERGFNQSHWMAKEVARFLNMPFGHVLRRRRHAPRQAGFSLEERSDNVRGAFEATGDLKGKRIVLVDDVATSLATADEAAKVLRGAGATWIGLITLARTLRREG